MNVFEDLIVELKQENLLEKTVIDDLRPGEASRIHDTDEPALAEPATPEHSELTSTEAERVQNEAEASHDLSDRVEIDGYDAHLHDTDEPAVRSDTEVPAPKKPRNGQEFYRKRAMAEVSNLQMVEHVLTGVEREYLKIVPKTYDDFEAKKALNNFLQVNSNENSPEHQEAEFALMSETERWCTSLAERDKAIPVSNIRRFCENSRPPLSSQALVALARFYRNLPHCENVRAKFDFVMTRLFSRPVENERRVCFFSNEETLGHLNALYKEWSSIALYGANGNDSDLSLAALSFEDLAIEAENAATFDQLIEKDFFGRVRMFKESINELFYAPTVLAAAIDANVRIGNAYVTLIGRERQRVGTESIHDKYADRFDDTVAEGIARSMGLNEILQESATAPSPAADEVPAAPDDTAQPEVPSEQPAAVPRKPRNLPPFIRRLLDNAFAVNRWVLAVSVLLIAASLGVYLYANFFVSESTSSAGVRVLPVEDPAFRDYLTTARVSGDKFYGLLTPNWDNLSKEKREEVLLKIYDAGKTYSYQQVTLIDRSGKNVAFASPGRLDVVME